MWHVHTIEYYLAIKRRGLLIHHIKWVNLDSSVTEERSQPQRSHTMGFHLYENYQIGKFIKTNSRLVFATLGWGRMETGVAFNGVGVFWGDDNVFNIGHTGGCMTP
jgi:hypothetical protein